MYLSVIIYQSINVLFYVCSHQGDIRPQKTNKQKNIFLYYILAYPPDYEQSI